MSLLYSPSDYSALYQKVFDTVAAFGCRTIRCVTSPANKASISFHRRMGFSVETSAKIVDGLPVFEGYDGFGEDRVLFTRTLT